MLVPDLLAHGQKSRAGGNGGVARRFEQLVSVSAAFAMSPHIRISTATSNELLSQACTRIAEFCGGLK